MACFMGDVGGRAANNMGVNNSASPPAAAPIPATTSMRESVFMDLYSTPKYFLHLHPPFARTYSRNSFNDELVIEWVS